MEIIRSPFHEHSPPPSPFPTHLDVDIIMRRYTTNFCYYISIGVCMIDGRIARALKHTEHGALTRAPRRSRRTVIIRMRMLRFYLPSLYPTYPCVCAFWLSSRRLRRPNYNPKITFIPVELLWLIRRLIIIRSSLDS